jgi:hypothetical protein
MGSWAEMQTTVHQVPVGKKQRLDVAAPPARPDQVWDLLTPQQQQQTFQTLVLVGQTLIHAQSDSTPGGEITHEQL